eukprot:7874239-Alexandrium_andersonii.AAC.1
MRLESSGGGQHELPAFRHHGWHYLPPKYNFEIDKHVRVPFDFSREHRRLAEEAWDSIAVFHYSGSECKPWSFCFKEKGKQEQSQQQQGQQQEQRQEQQQQQQQQQEEQQSERPSQQALLAAVAEKFASDPRIAEAITEWLSQLFRLEEFLGDGGKGKGGGYPPSSEGVPIALSVQGGVGGLMVKICRCTPPYVTRQVELSPAFAAGSAALGAG